MDREALRTIAHEEMIKWGLSQDGWSFKFNTAISCAGMCYEVEKEIRISGPICDVKSQDFMLDTVRHEIAHAKAGNEHSHDAVWRDWAQKIGCTDLNVTYQECDAIEQLRRSKAKYACCVGDNKIVKLYLRKPNAKTLATIKERWLPGYKKETKGKLYIVPFNASIHTEYFV